MIDPRTIAHHKIADALNGMDPQDACIILTYVLCQIVHGMGEDREFLIHNVGKQFDIFKRSEVSMQ
jgi:hypothetical protein